MISNELKAFIIDEPKLVNLIDYKSFSFSKEIKNIPNEVLGLSLTTQYKINYSLPCKFWLFKGKFGISLKKGLKPSYSVGEILYIKEPFFIAEDGEVLYKYLFSDCDIKFKSERYLDVSNARFFIQIKEIKLNKIDNFYLNESKNDDVVKPTDFGNEAEKFNKERYSHKYEVEYLCELVDSPFIKSEILNQEAINYFYRIKIPKLADAHSFGNEWEYKVFDVGYIKATSKKEARALLEDEFNSKMCMKSKAQDIGVKNLYLLSLYEPTEHWGDFWSAERECAVCNTIFSKLQRDKAFDFKHIRSDYCCLDCEEIGESERDRNREENRLNSLIEEDKGIYQPCIYKITNKITNMCYVGQTSQAFTFRWYQHFMTSSGGSKFYEAINDSPVTDWIFEVIETISKKDIAEYMEKCGEKINRANFINVREQYWINQFDSIRNGYNSGVANKELHLIHTKYSDGLFDLNEVSDDFCSK